MTDQANSELPEDRRSPSSGNAQKTMTDLLALPDSERTLMNWLVRRRQASFAELLDRVGGDAETLKGMIERLISAGFLTADGDSGESVFKPNLVSRKTRTLPNQVWDALG